MPNLTLFLTSKHCNIYYKISFKLIRYSREREVSKCSGLHMGMRKTQKQTNTIGQPENENRVERNRSATAVNYKTGDTQHITVSVYSKTWERAREKRYPKIVAIIIIDELCGSAAPKRRERESVRVSEKERKKEKMISNWIAVGDKSINSINCKYLLSRRRNAFVRLVFSLISSCQVCFGVSVFECVD